MVARLLLVRLLAPVALLATIVAGPAVAQTWVSITPTNRVVAGSNSLSVTVLWCDYSGQIDPWDYRSITLNGVDITSQFDLQDNPIACGFHGKESDQIFMSSTGTITLDSTTTRSYTLSAGVYDMYYYQYWSASTQYKLPDPRRHIVVLADAQFVQVAPSTSPAPRFTITNASSDKDTATISVTCARVVGSGCALTPSTNPVILNAGQNTSVTVTYTDSARLGATALITLRASDATMTDSSWSQSTVTALASPGVAIVGYAPGVDSVLERNLCVTVSAGSGAAAECGDLRLAHTLPAVRTLGTQRVPTLLYNSQHARPKPLVLANITLSTTGQGGAQYPDSVHAIIWRTDNGPQRGSASWPGGQWGGLGVTRRVVIPATDDTAWATGVYNYRIIATYYWHNGSTPSDTSAISQLLVVNRSASHFGAGWWLAGLEQLKVLSGTQVMWVGGDGSARIYTKYGSGTYHARNLAWPDSITYNDTTLVYTRWAPGGAKVFFNGAGRHDSTMNRLQYATHFGYGTSGCTDCLASIQVPTPGGSLTYTLSYNGSNILSGVAAPRASQQVSRQVTVSTTGAVVNSIQDPDGTQVQFGGYGTGLNQYRIGSRTDRSGNVTTYSWSDALQRLTQVTLPQSISTTFAFAETQGYSTALPLDSAYTSISGPRTDVTQVTKVWINGYGAPTRIRNAVGRETQVIYDAYWPGLAQTVIAPTGLRTQRVYDLVTALATADTAFNPLGNNPSQKAVTQYQWNPKWREITQITSATGVVMSFAYHDSLGYRLWEQLGLSQSRRVNYTYNANRLLSSVSPPLVPAQTFAYDWLGNLDSATTSAGYVTSSYEDSVGRVTRVVTPLNTIRTWYSLMDRVDSTRTSGPQVTTPDSTHPADSVLVSHRYDAEGHDTATFRVFNRNGQSLSVLARHHFDSAGRLYWESTTEGGGKNYMLDKAGNDTLISPDRGVGLVRVAYDALNRPTRRVLAQVNYANIQCVLLTTYCNYGGVSFPTRDGPTVCLATDTSYFDYDPAGNVRRADNGWAWVHRTYTPSGRLAYDTLVVRTYETSAPDPCGPGDRHSGGYAAGVNGDFNQHVYALQYGYDLDGRRDSLYHPDGVDFCSGYRCVTRYAYDATTGLMDTVADPLGKVTTFGYDALGRVTSTTYPGGVVANRGYDADSRVISRTGPFFTNDALQYDAADRVVSGSIADVGGGGPNTVGIYYGPLGGVVYSEGLNPGATFEEATLDGLGNRVWQRAVADTDSQRTLYLSPFTSREDSTRLVGVTAFDPYNQYPNHYARLVHATQFDADGNLQVVYGWTYNGVGFPPKQSVSYFDAEDRLRIFNQHVDIGMPGTTGGIYEEYRYDALGRRVLVRSRCTNQRSNSWCRGYVERTIWDGDQVLYEIRGKGDDSASTADEENDFFSGLSSSNYDVVLGRVGYVHAGGIDAPVAVYRMGLYGQPSPVAVAPHANWKGDYEVGSVIGGTYNGYNTRSCQGSYDCPLIDWSGGLTTMDGVKPPPTIHTWFGNLITQHTDGSGLHYLRNRYYDPSTGRFTQADPIGLGGGLNLYGFAGGDPVTFADPFGLDTLRYNGRTLTLIGDDGKTRWTGTATSGRPGSTAQDQDKPEEGPIPSGEYTLNPNEISHVTGFRYFERNLLGDWGHYRAPLHPDQGTDTHGRSGFYLHGGSTPGSAGCIDVGQRDISLFRLLQQEKDPVNVIVQYPSPATPTAP